MHKLMLFFTIVGRGLLQCLLIIALTYFFCRALPGDAADVLGLEGGLTDEQTAGIRRSMGLDAPWLIQFGNWLAHACQGQLGESLRFGRPVSEMLINALPVTLKLTAWALLLGLVLALSLSIWAATRHSSLAERLVEGLNAWSIAMPTFCAGVVFLLIFSVELHWLYVS